jgi:thioredoxin reductase (NADPH)
MPSTRLHTPALIAGAGPIGLACAISAQRRGIKPLVIDAGAIANSITRYPVGMTFFTTPERLEIGHHPMVTSGAKPTREEALMYYRGVARAEGIEVQPYTRLIEVARQGTHLVATVERGIGRITREQISCDRLILATGYLEHPNRIGVEGEELPHVSHYPEEAHRTSGLDVVIVGAKNSAVEMALNSFRAGARVTLVHRGTGLRPSVKYWLSPDFMNRVKAGEIAVRWEHQVQEITPDNVVLTGPAGEVERIPADLVYLLTGYHPDFELFERLGLTLDPVSGRPDHNPESLETTVPGIYLAGSITAGKFISEIFIENGKYDGEKIFGDERSRKAAQALAGAIDRPLGE